MWLRSEWDEGITAKQFDEAARSLGVDSLDRPCSPRPSPGSRLRCSGPQQARCATGDRPAGIPQDDEGRQARSAMQTRLNRATDQVNAYVRDVISKANVHLAAGRHQAGHPARGDRGRRAGRCDTALPRFTEADDNRWPQVIARVKSGSAVDALKAVQYDGDLSSTASSGRYSIASAQRGLQLVTSKRPSPRSPSAGRGTHHGRPRVLLDTGVIRATLNGSDATTADVLKQTRLGSVQLRREVTVLKPAEKIQGAPAAEQPRLFDRQRYSTRRSSRPSSRSSAARRT